MTIKNCYPLPLIQELVNCLKQSKYFTKLDVQWGYNNICIKEGDEWKATFITNRSLYEPTVMFFGLTNSPAMFQAMMNLLFHDLIGHGKVVIYLNDILIFSESLEDHERTVAQVLEILRKNKLYLKPEKCDFHKTSIEYLSMIIEHGQVRMDPAKVTTVAEWPVPLKKKDLQSLIGFCNYYCHFIQDFSHIAHPLHDLTHNIPYVWTDSQ